MNAYCRKYEWMGIGKANRHFQIGRPIARSYESMYFSPASRARAITASRSAENCWSSR